MACRTVANINENRIKICRLSESCAKLEAAGPGSLRLAGPPASDGEARRRSEAQIVTVIMIVARCAFKMIT
jgi:hypothetical protein